MPTHCFKHSEKDSWLIEDFGCADGWKRYRFLGTKVSDKQNQDYIDYFLKEFSRFGFIIHKTTITGNVFYYADKKEHGGRVPFWMVSVSLTRYFSRVADLERFYHRFKPLRDGGFSFCESIRLSHSTWYGVTNLAFVDFYDKPRRRPSKQGRTRQQGNSSVFTQGRYRYLNTDDIDELRQVLKTKIYDKKTIRLIKKIYKRLYGTNNRKRS